MHHVQLQSLKRIEEGTANRLQGLTYGGEGNPNHQCTQCHTAAHETGRVLVAAKDGAFCMEVRVMIKQVEIPKCQHFGFVSKTPRNSCSSCSISAAFHHTILVHSPLAEASVRRAYLVLKSYIICYLCWSYESTRQRTPHIRTLRTTMCLSGSKERFTLVVFWRCCCMGANRGASRLSPSLAYATGITNAYVKCAG